MPANSPNSLQRTLTHPTSQFVFETQPTPYHGQNCQYVLKLGRFSCPVKKVTPKFGSTVKTFSLEILSQTFFMAFCICWLYAISFVLHYLVSYHHIEAQQTQKLPAYLPQLLQFPRYYISCVFLHDSVSYYHIEAQQI